jgi:hypothetical protein
MLGHESNASVQVGKYIGKLNILNQLPGARAVETPHRALEIGVVMKIGPDVVSKALETMLLRYEILTSYAE